MQNQSDVENRINELANAIQVLENYYESIISRIYLIGQAIEETKAAQAAIETLPEGKEAEIVVPLGGDVLLKTKADSSSKIMLKVGGGVLMVKKKDDALNFLKERIGELEKALSSAQQDKKTVEDKLEEARYELNELLKRSQNVR
ncbi:MAG: prefoldin subunit alpha [Nitrososphaeria archaeon]